MKIVLCGSIKRHWEKFEQYLFDLAIKGHVVYGVNTYKSRVAGSISDSEKTILDLVHLAKIEESDAVLILDEDYYIGESTMRELMWARLRGKLIYSLSGRSEVGESVYHIGISNPHLQSGDHQISPDKLDTLQGYGRVEAVTPPVHSLDDEIPF